MKVACGQTGFAYNSPSTEHLWGGPVLRNIEFRADACSPNPNSGTGVVINDTNDFFLENVSASDFEGGYGFIITATSDLAPSQYGTLLNCRAYNDKFGMKLHNTSGVRVIASHLDGNYNNQAGHPIRATSIGLWTTGSTG